MDARMYKRQSFDKCGLLKFVVLSGGVNLQKSLETPKFKVVGIDTAKTGNQRKDTDAVGQRKMQR